MSPPVLLRPDGRRSSTGRPKDNGMESVDLDHRDPAVAAALHSLMVASYAVEAEVIGVPDFAPLRRNAQAIQRSEGRFTGLFRDGQLVAAAEIEDAGHGGWHIGSFVVDPERFREGLGSRLLSDVLASAGGVEVTVSTAIANRPAVRLYQKHGFTVDRTWSTPCGIPMVTLRR
jgi:ribosomal protein S18 acetylase RimI-like enzyme